MFSPQLSKTPFVRKEYFPEVLDIDRLCYPVPWDMKVLLEVLRDRNVRCFVYREDNLVKGYIVFFRHKAEGRITVVRLGVYPDDRRQKIGSALLRIPIRQIGLLSGLLKLRCCIREDNLVGQLFLRDQGFTARKVRRNFHFDERDSYVFEYWHKRRAIDLTGRISLPQTGFEIDSI